MVVGHARPEHAVVEANDRHVGVGHRQAVVEARDEDECVLRAVFDADAEVGDLHQRRHRVVATVRARMLERLSGLHCRPDQARARRLQRARQIESVRLDGVSGQPEHPMERRRRRREMKLLLRKLKNRRHQLVRLDRHRPLRDVDEVASGERQRAAAGLPHAVTVTEARERASVPVLDDAGPRVAEHLAVDRLQPGVDRHGVSLCGRLRIESEIFEGETPDRLAAAPGRLSLSARHHGCLPRADRDVAHPHGGPQPIDEHRRPKRGEVIGVRIALRRAVEPVDEQGPIKDERVRLHSRRRGGPLHADDPRVDRQQQVTVCGRRVLGLQDDQIRRGGESFLVPIGRQPERHRRLGGGDGRGRRDLRIELRGGRCAHARPRLRRQARRVPLDARASGDRLGASHWCG